MPLGQDARRAVSITMRLPLRFKYNPLSFRFYCSAYSYGLHTTLGLIKGFLPLAKKPAGLAAAFLDRRLGDQVSYGEFAAMNFKPARGHANQYYGKLLGVYERELGPIWQAAAAL
jgi:hypothetical protein